MERHLDEHPDRPDGKAKADDKLPTDRDGMRRISAGFVRHATSPIDKMVYELVSATGTSKPGEEGYNGAVNFLIGKMDDNGIQATAKTAQIFLGLSVQCTQCHNHPFNDWKQNSFWEMNAFFRQTKVNKTMGARKRRSSMPRSSNRGFPRRRGR